MRIVALPIFRGVNHSMPIPPWVLSSPSSRTNFPGPTCSQPVKPPPSKIGCHPLSATAGTATPRAANNSMTGFIISVLP